MAFIQGLAGPSRLGFASFTGRRTLMTAPICLVSRTAFRFEQPKTSLPRPTAIRTTRPIRPVAPVVPPKRVTQEHPSKTVSQTRSARQPSVSAPAPDSSPVPASETARPTKTDSWPWQTVDDPTKDYIEETRTIFARPYSGNPRSLILGYFLGATIIAFVCFVPSTQQVFPSFDPAGPKPELHELTTADYAMRLGAILVTLGIINIANRLLWNNVVRVAQVRRIPRNSTSPSSIKIRLETAFDQARLPFRPLYTDFDPSDTAIYTLKGRKYAVGMTAGKHIDYMINLSVPTETDIANAGDSDIVVSTSRLETVFGPIKEEEPSQQAARKKSISLFDRFKNWTKNEGQSISMFDRFKRWIKPERPSRQQAGATVASLPSSSKSQSAEKPSSSPKPSSIPERSSRKRA